MAYMTIMNEYMAQRMGQENPIRVALVGAGASAKMIALQLLTPPQGVRLMAIANRTTIRAGQAYQDAGVNSVTSVNDLASLENDVSNGSCVVTDNAMLLCEARNIDLIIDATGSVEFGARLAVFAIENHKHLVLVNTELDSTLGPILKIRADQAGVIVTNTDGDEPGVAMTLLRYLKYIGL